eukprot:1403080-Rhodomonas_salina.1
MSGCGLCSGQAHPLTPSPPHCAGQAREGLVRARRLRHRPRAPPGQLSPTLQTPKQETAFLVQTVLKTRFLVLDFRVYAVGLCLCYGISGTDVGHRATAPPVYGAGVRFCNICSTEWAYGATASAVLMCRVATAYPEAAQKLPEATEIQEELQKVGGIKGGFEQALQVSLLPA